MKNAKIAIKNIMEILELEDFVQENVHVLLAQKKNVL